MSTQLSSVDVGMIREPYPDFGQVHYVVDTAFRTQAQGWTRADRTGPLDLLEARRAPSGVQYVFRSGDYANSAACLQAANDAMVPYRGDVLFFTPCSLTVTAPVNVTCQDARWLSRPVVRPGSHASIICGTNLAISLPIGANNIEIAYLRLVPNVTSPCVNIVDAAYGYMHNVFSDMQASATIALTSRLFQITGTSSGLANDWLFDNIYHLTSGPQGPMGVVTGTTAVANGLILKDITHRHGVSTLAIGLLDIGCTLSHGILVQGGAGYVTGVTSIVTTVVNVTNMTNNLGCVHAVNWRSAIGYALVSTFFTLAGATAEASLANCIIGITTTGAGGTTFTG